MHLDKKDWLLVSLEEYKTLREESLTALKHQQYILQWGLIAVITLFTAGFGVWDRKLLSEAIFLVVLPFLCYTILIIWMHELARMNRAGAFLRSLENKINTQFENMPEALSWENWISQCLSSKNTNLIFLNHYPMVLLFIGTAITSIAIGLIKYGSLLHVPVLAIEVGFLFLAISLVYKIGHQFNYKNKSDENIRN